MHINVAPLKATRTLCLSEKSLGLGVITGYTTAIEALNSFDVQSFKNKVSTSGLDDIQVRLGATLKNKGITHVDIYGVGVIPTSNEQMAYYFAEPMRGNGKHGGMGCGLQGYSTFAHDELYRWRLMFDARFIHNFDHGERRTFDLNNGDWSRYLLCAYEEVTTIALPLIQTLTSCCRVKSQNQVSFLVGSEQVFGNYWVRYGVNFWWRQRERIRVNPINFGTLGIYDLVGARLGNPVSASKAQIWQTAGGANAAPSDTAFTRITFDDINLRSAASPEASTLKLFGGVGYLNTSRVLEVGLNGFYEFSNCHAALNQWGIFGSLSWYLF